ncbi:MAG: Mur ligase domain-containing protein, partial [Ginsengibacter sp.]
MASLREILYRVHLETVVGDTAVQVLSLQIDSRKVKPGSCFIAVRGTVTDGHEYIQTAIDNGAIVIVCEKAPSILKEEIH